MLQKKFIHPTPPTLAKDSKPYNDNEIVKIAIILLFTTLKKKFKKLKTPSLQKIS